MVSTLHSFPLDCIISDPHFCGKKIRQARGTRKSRGIPFVSALEIDRRVRLERVAVHAVPITLGGEAEGAVRSDTSVHISLGVGLPNVLLVVNLTVAHS